MWFLDNDGILKNVNELELLNVLNNFYIGKNRWVLEESNIKLDIENLDKSFYKGKLRWHIFDKEPFLVNILNEDELDFYPKYLEFYVEKIDKLVRVKLSKTVLSGICINVILNDEIYYIDLIKGEDFLNVVINDEIYHINYSV